MNSFFSPSLALRRLVSATLISIMVLSMPIAQASPADYSALFEQTRKSVVGVNALTLEDRQLQQFPFPFPFPNQPFHQQPQDENSPESPSRRFGFGSGVILDAAGHIITNAHVILDRESKEVDGIEIVMYDKKKYTATVIGFDIYTDIALLKIDPPEGTQLPVAQIGNSDELKVGQAVLALGHPLGLDYTLTSGIVSSLNRSLLGSATDRHVPFIQTDAVVNPGNSGGPLLDVTGKVIGINARIISGRSGGYIGYSLAIPINVAMEVQQALRTDGTIKRGMLGVTFDVEGISDDDAKVWGIDPERGGVLINSIIEGSAAEEAGLQPGDIILQFDGKELNDPANFPRYIANTQPGTKVQVTYFREGQEQTTGVTIGSIETGGQVVPEGNDEGDPNSKVPAEPFGMVFAPLPDNIKENLPSESGVFLEGFNDREGEVEIPQELYKLQSGDIILGVVIAGDFMQVSDPKELRKLLGNLETSVIGFQVLRNRGRPFFVTVNLTN